MDFGSLNIYWVMIALSLVIIFSYVFNYIAKVTKVPSVILLILTGFVASLFIPVDFEILKPFLEFLGAVGLIMIVLEASLDLELKRAKLGILFKAILSSLILLISGSYLIAVIIQFFFECTFIQALAYAIPLSIMSSAIIIPSVGHLDEHRREFLIFEASFSDIFGIMFFYFLIDVSHYDSTQEIVSHVATNISLTLVVSLLLGYLIILLIQKLTAQVKLFLPIAVLILLYSVGKLFHLSSLIFILVFGLMINNRHLFIGKQLKKLFKESKFEETFNDLKVITLESSFIVRTFFFIVFGMTITADGLNDPMVYVIGLAGLVILFATRWIVTSGLLRKEKFPAFYVAPRGLITILLFFAIPESLELENFRPAILLMVIIISNLIMTYGFVKYKPEEEEENSDDTITEKIDVSEEEEENL